MYAAAHNGNVKVLELLLGAGGDPNKADQACGTPLLIAIEQGNVEAVQALLEAGADPN